jgi:hypothetical protein
LSERRFIAEDGSMGQETKRSAEMRRVLEKYKASGLSRREFCLQRSIALTTFDYRRSEHAMRPRKQERRPRLVKAKVAASEAPGRGFTLNLADDILSRSSAQRFSLCRQATALVSPAREEHGLSKTPHFTRA